MKLIDILKEECWKGYEQIGMKEKDGKQVPNCVPIKESHSEKSPPFLYSPVGFSCSVCKFYYIEDGKNMCKNTYYQDYMGTAELIDNEGNQIKDPSKWCSNWFLPKGE